MSHSPSRTIALTLAALLVTAACARDEAETPADTAAPVVARDTAQVAGGAPRGPARDADHEFLRMMSDHHQGLVTMATAAMNSASTSQARDDAFTVGSKQDREMREMVELVQVAYGETIEPMMMPNHRAMNDSLQAMTGTAYDRAFYRMIVRHHREGIAMMDDFQSRVQRPEIRQMIDRMRTEQQREIQEFERKAAGTA